MKFKLLNIIIKSFKSKDTMSMDMYNTEIYKNGLSDILSEYKGTLESDLDINKRKIKEVQFHLDILNKSIKESI